MKLRFEVGAGRTDYEKYLRTTELLKLQKPPAEVSSEDELQFQVVHQVEELWMKLVLHEIARVRQQIEGDLLTQAIHTLRRIHEVERLMTENLRLLNTMSPFEYQKIRMGLGHGSGMESPGFNWILQRSPELWEAFAALLARRGVTLEAVHREPTAHHDVFLVAEGLADHDEYFHRFLYHHWLLIQRIIGAQVLSLKGVEADQVQVRIRHRFYPELWAVRERLTDEWNEKRGLVRQTEQG